MIHWRDHSQATAPLGYIWWFTEGIIPRPLHHWDTFGDSLKGPVPGHCTTGLHLVIHWRDQSQATKPLGYIWWFTEGISPRPLHHWATFGDSLKGSVPGHCTTGLHLVIHWRDQSQATKPLGYIWWFTEGISPRPLRYIWWFTEGISPRPLHHWATFGDSLKGSVPGH